MRHILGDRGRDLSRRIARGAIPLDEALPIAKQIAEALDQAKEGDRVCRTVPRAPGAESVRDPQQK
jgi:hypothetical protein